MLRARALPCARSRDRVGSRDGFLHFPGDHQPEVEPPEPVDPEGDPLHEPLLLPLDPVSQLDELEDPEE